jgi:hypothetical protein
MLKTCKECKKELSYDLFHVKGKTVRGAIKRDTICKNCKSSVHARLIELYGDSGDKQCSACQKNLPWEDFSYKIFEQKRYLRSKCKKCSLQSWNNWAALHPEHKNKKSESDRRCHKDYKKYHRHGITKDQYLLMLQVQNGVCAICNKLPKDGHDLAIDHNHLTQDVRGLLCKACNRALGLFGDNIESVQNALFYLEKRGSYG